jgi:hypothetical protein
MEDCGGVVVIRGG